MSAPITLVGNLVEDPELRFTPSGAAVASFRLAVDERRQNPQTKEWEDAGASFYRITGWRNTAENVAESLRRGTRVIVVGDLTIRQYSKQDGTRGVSPEVTARSVGPDLTHATASVTRNERSSGGDAADARPAQTPPAQTPPADPWATGPLSGDEPPF